jgi:triosephosphate isomerase
MPPLPRPRRLVGVSLKMYFDLPSTLSYVRGVLQLDGEAWNARIDLFVIPDFVSLTESARILEPSSIMLGAQDTFWEDKGAHTGEVSPLVLRQAGARIVEIGHAERRAQFGETDEWVAKKAGAAARNGLIPLVCIGERTHHSVASAAVGAAIVECKPQVMAVLAAVPDDTEVVLAYEPVWDERIEKVSSWAQRCHKNRLWRECRTRHIRKDFRRRGRSVPGALCA